MNLNRGDNEPSQETEIDLIDIEDHAKANGGKPPKARRYRIRVDREKFTVEVSSMKGKEILTLAGKTPPERYLLNQKFRNGQVVPIGLEDNVDFTAPGVERFTTLPKDQTEGLVETLPALRRSFALPEDDVAQLEAAGYQWETISENWFLAHDFAVPAGYNLTLVSLAVQVPNGYPTSSLDMAFFYPWLQLSNSRTIPRADQGALIDGKKWQRWSRHYSPQNPWLAGEYNIITHLQLVRAWLERESSRN
jgi:hypothetical protein